MARNPPWTQDELILALDLFFRHNPLHISKSHPAVVDLSKTLNSLGIHPQSDAGRDFRNPNGVYMKLCNYLRFDPSYDGKGLQAGNRLEEEIWDEFSRDKDRLRATAAAIVAGAKELTKASQPITVEEDGTTEAVEGKVLTRTHRVRERNQKIIKRKKEHVLNTTGQLQCEACGFDFETQYGQLGQGFCECHHVQPLSELKPGQPTRIIDLAIVCSNCHKMIHRARPWRTVSGIASIVRTGRNRV